MTFSDNAGDGITILYGSETGNAEDYARYLSIQLKYLNLKPILAPLDEYPMKKLITDTKYLIVICSTSGQGDLPRNAQKFMKFLLKKKLPADLFNHIKLSTLGLGDSSYSRFNYAIRKLHTRLAQLGCMELSTRCEADEMSPEGVDGYYKEWEVQLVSQLRKYFPHRLPRDETDILLPENALSLHEADMPIEVDRESTYLSRARESIKIGTIIQNKRITSEDHFQDVRHVIIESSGLSYSPGDCAALYPINDGASVDLLIQSQPHWIEFADKPLSIAGNYTLDGGIIDTSKLTLRSLFTFHLDIVAIPRRSFFKSLWHFVNTSSDSGARESEKLQEFASFEDTEELYDYANRPRRSILETILEFQGNLVIPISRVFDLFPKIKPRLFSIASKPSETQLELVVALVEYKTMIRRIRRGLCSKWLKSVKQGDRIIFSIVKSHIKFNLESPLILIAPGTGIAPMKSLIEKVTQSDTNHQDLYLFYGCRYKDKDLLFGNLWSELVYKNKLNFYPCFSRDTDTKAKYVQDKLFQEYSVIGDLIVNRGATVFVCGSSGAMPKQVKLTLAEIAKKQSNLSDEEANKFVIAMEDEGRYIEDTW